MCVAQIFDIIASQLTWREVTRTTSAGWRGAWRGWRTAPGVSPIWRQGPGSAACGSTRAGSRSSTWPRRPADPPFEAWPNHIHPRGPPLVSITARSAGNLFSHPGGFGCRPTGGPDARTPRGPGATRPHRGLPDHVFWHDDISLITSPHVARSRSEARRSSTATSSLSPWPAADGLPRRPWRARVGA